MSKNAYPHVIVGGGLAGASAVQGIRDVDKDAPVLLVGGEKHLPYNRPPLSKQLWFGKMKVDEIFVNGREFYDQNGIDLALGARVVRIDPGKKSITCEDGAVYGYGKLLLATGGITRKLPIPGGDLDGVCYYRYLDDYLRTRGEATEGKTAVVIGGGFIGTEVAAALNINKIGVTMIFPSKYICSRVFPDYLGLALQRHYMDRGVNVLAGEKPVSISRSGGRFVTRTTGGGRIESDMVIAGVGISPEAGLAEAAGLLTGDGIAVNEYLQTSDPDIYAAGDNAFFPYQALGINTRVEHWDNAMSQGISAGRNMAGAHEPFTYMPFFFSDLFKFGYEAVGEVDSRLDTFADWQKENETGVIYYLKDGRVRGMMMCNLWERVDEAREIIKRGERVEPASLRGAIK